MKKNLIKSERSIYFLFAGISIILSVIILVLSSGNLEKFKFSKYKELLEGGDFSTISYYSDLDNDGVSERIPIGFSKSQQDHFLQIFDVKGNFRKQFNFYLDKIFYFLNLNHKAWMTFEDWNGDGYKDIFCPSMQKDTLFLNIISTKKLKFELKRRPILFRKNIKKNLEWKIDGIYGKTLDVNGDGSKDLILSFATGFPLQPRGFMTFDIKNNAIIDTFFTKAYVSNFTVIDLDNDGEEEILCGTGAGGNYSDTSGISDNKVWFFALNKDLSFKFPPRGYGKVQSSLDFTVKDSGIKLVAARINKNSDAVYERISSSGILLERKVLKNFNAKKIHHFLSANNEMFFLVSTKDNQTKLYSADMELIVQKRDSGNFLYAGDLTGDGVKELIFKYKNNYIVTDQKLEKIAELKLKQKSVEPEIVLFGKGKKNGIAIQTANANTIYQLNDNPLKKYFLPAALLLSLVLFLIFAGIHLVLKQISIFYHTFLFFIRHDDSSLLLLNSNGKILRYNKQFENLLLESGYVKKKHFGKALRNYKNIVEIIKQSMANQIEKHEELSIYKKNISFKGKIEVIPFRAFLGFSFAYLVRIVDQTSEIISERIQVWSHTAQKVAHEIKTPLGSIQLNLRALKKRLEKESLSNPEIADDVETIDNEINRIKSLTSSLLKSTNLEKFNIKAYSLKLLIEDSMQKFRGYFKSGIEIFIDPKIEWKTILFDKSQFIEALQIVIENSIDALHGKGKIDIYIEDGNEHFLTLIIKDYGEGIDAANISKIFEPYYTSKREGTGLGLAFAKKIMEDNHGTIEINSTKGKGTIVKLTLRVKNEV